MIVVGNNPLSFTDPSGMGEGSTLCAGGAIACGIGIGIDIGIALWKIFGGGHDTPSLANFPFPNQFPGVSPSGGDPWNERIPYQLGGGELNKFIIKNYIPGIHRDMTVDAAIAAGIPLAQAFILANGVMHVDFLPGSQGPGAASAHIHAMGGRLSSGAYDTCGSAYSAAISDLQHDIDAAARGDQQAEFRAIHRIQDSYASGHQYKVWKPGLFGLPSLAHDAGDLNRSPDPQNATTRLLLGLQGKSPMGNAESYLYRPNNCHSKNGVDNRCLRTT